MSSGDVDKLLEIYFDQKRIAKILREVYKEFITEDRDKKFLTISGCHNILLLPDVKLNIEQVSEIIKSYVGYGRNKKERRRIFYKSAYVLINVKHKNELQIPLTEGIDTVILFNCILNKVVIRPEINTLRSISIYVIKSFVSRMDVEFEAYKHLTSINIVYSCIEELNARVYNYYPSNSNCLFAINLSLGLTSKILDESYSFIYSEYEYYLSNDYIDNCIAISNDNYRYHYNFYVPKVNVFLECKDEAAKNEIINNSNVIKNTRNKIKIINEPYVLLLIHKKRTKFKNLYISTDNNLFVSHGSFNNTVNTHLVRHNPIYFAFISMADKFENVDYTFINTTTIKFPEEFLEKIKEKNSKALFMIEDDTKRNVDRSFTYEYLYGHEFSDIVKLISLGKYILFDPKREITESDFAIDSEKFMQTVKKLRELYSIFLEPHVCFDIHSLQSTFNYALLNTIKEGLSAYIVMDFENQSEINKYVLSSYALYEKG